MNNDKLRESIEAATEKIFDGYEHQGAGLRCYGKAPSGEFGWFYRTKPQVTDIILGELTPLFPAPEPVDDKALAEALKQLAQLRYNSITVDVCAIDTVLAALRAARHKAENSTVVFKEATAARERDFELGQRGLLDRAMAAETKFEAAQRELTDLRKDKERLEAAIKHERGALYIYRDRQNGTASHKDITTGIELLDAALYPRAAGEGKGAT